MTDEKDSTERERLDDDLEIDAEAAEDVKGGALIEGNLKTPLASPTTTTTTTTTTSPTRPPSPLGPRPL